MDLIGFVFGCAVSAIRKWATWRGVNADTKLGVYWKRHGSDVVVAGTLDVVVYAIWRLGLLDRLAEGVGLNLMLSPADVAPADPFAVFFVALLVGFAAQELGRWTYDRWIKKAKGNG